MRLPFRLIPAATSLHSKLVVTLAILVVLVVTGADYVLVEHERETRKVELEAPADHLVDLFSRSVAHSVRSVDLVAIDEQLALLASDPELAQISVAAAGYGVLREVVNPTGLELTDPVAQVQALNFAPVDAAPKRIGEVRIDLSRAPAEGAIASARGANFMQVIVTMAVLYAVTLLLLRRIVTAPLNRLEKVVDRIALGDLGARCVVESGDEFGRLAIRINTMADRLRESDGRLRDSQESLAITLNSISDAVIATDTAGLVTRMNPAAERLTAWVLADALGQPLTEVFRIVNAETRLPLLNPVQTVMEQGKVVGLANHTTLLARDGQEYQIDDSAAPICNAAGRIVGVVLVFNDVTEKYRAARAVVRATELLETTGSLAKVGGWEVNLQTMKLSWTRETFRIAELESEIEPALGEGLKLFAPEARPTIAAAVQAAIACGTPYDLELPLIAFNGQSKWVRTQGFAEMHEGRALRIYGTFQDVSERRAAEAAQHESESRYITLIEQAPICIHELDLDGKLTSMNGSGLAMMGLADQCQIQGLSYLEAVADEDKARVSDLLAQSFAGASSSFEFKAVGPAEQQYQSRLVPIKNGNGDVIRLMGMSEDITSRRNAQMELQETVRDKSALLMEVHHRVKNNLQVIISLLRMESRRSQLPEAIEVLQAMQGRIHAMAMLHKSLYRSGTFASIDLGSYLGRIAMQAFQSQALDTKRVQLKLNMASLLVGIDQATAAGLLLNELISNCLAHGFPGERSGEVSVELQAAQANDPATGDSWRLRISDTGVGLPSDFEERRTRSLGLQLVDDLSHQLGGGLEIVSRPFQGAQFSIVFTALEPAALVMPI